MISLVLASVIETKQQIQPTSDHNRVERQHVLWKKKLLNSLSVKLLLLIYSIFLFVWFEKQEKAVHFTSLLWYCKGCPM